MISCNFISGKDLQLERTVGFRKESPVFSEGSDGYDGDVFHNSGGERFQSFLEEKAISARIEFDEALCRRVGCQFRKKPESFVGSGSIL